MKSHFEKAFYRDGSLRDIYVRRTKQSDWSLFFDLLAQYDVEFTYDGEPVSLPRLRESLFKSKLGKLACIHLDEVVVNCHFFCVDEIELDIDPYQIETDMDADHVLRFMMALGSRLQKDVVLTDEGAPQSIWFKYDHSANRILFLDS